MNLHLALLLIYSVALTVLGVWIGRQVRGPADFFVAGRRLRWPLLFSTVLAANIGAGSTVGAAGLAYQQGISAWWWNGAAGLGSLLLAFVIGPRIWTLAAARHYLTVGDFLEDRYDQTVRGVIASLIWIGTLFILAGQLLAGAAVFEIVAGLPRAAGVAIGGLAMTTYFAAGGLLSSAWVNAVQLVVLLSGFAVAVPITLAAVGGLEGIAAAAPSASYMDPFYSAGYGSGFTMLLLLGPNFIVSPGLVQKAYGAASARDVRFGIGVNGIVLMVFAFVPVFIGMSGVVQHPGIAERDLVLPTVLLHDLPPWLGALALAAVFSAEVSTCDAILFMLSTSLSQDLYRRFIRQDASPERVLFVARWAAVVGGIAGMVIAVAVTKTIVDALGVFYSIVGATLLVPIVGGLFVKRAGAREAMAAILCGMLTLLAVRYGTDGRGWWNPNLWGLVASGVGFAVSYLLRAARRR